jgi:integrase
MRRVEMEIQMRVSGKGTRYPGVYRINDNTYRIRVKATDPRTGKARQIERVLEGVSAQEAARQRAESTDQIKAGNVGGGERLRVGEYARSWIESKARGIDQGTADRYGTALDCHILRHELGDIYCDVLTPMDVQGWVNFAFKKINPKSGKVYDRTTVFGWWKVLRTMLRDAVEQLGLPRDPTRRIIVPELEPKAGNALTIEKLARFLGVMRVRFPQHFAYSAARASTGMRACHVSALQWPDIDEAAAVIRVERKQVEGVVGPVSTKKRAPREFPLEPELLEILRDHRKRMVAMQAPGLDSGWVFPSVRAGKLRGSNSMAKAWRTCLEKAGITERFTPHGLRRTFNDMLRRAKVDPIIAKALTGHVTEQMREHYSTVGLDEKRAAVASVLMLLPRGESADNGADAGTPANDATDGEAAKVAK